MLIIWDFDNSLFQFFESGDLVCEFDSAAKLYSFLESCLNKGADGDD